MYQFRNILNNLFFKKPKTKEQKLELYKGLDTIPLYNWKRLYVEKDLKYLIIKEENRNFTLSHKNLAELEHQWYKIYDEYLLDFGLTKKMIRILEIEKQIALLKCDLWLDNNKFLKNKIRILDKKLIKEKGNTIDEKGNDFERQLVLIEKWLQSSINPKEISARKYFTYLQIINEESDKYKMTKATQENGKN